MSEDRKIVESISADLADHLQSLLDAGYNAGHVADAAIMAACSLRVHISGPLMLAGILGTLCQRFRADAESPGAGRAN